MWHECLRRATFQVVRLFLCLGQMQALALPQKNTWSATSRLNMCNKEYCLWGCGDRNIFDFQRYSRFTSLSLGGQVPLSATILTFPPNLPLRKGGYKLSAKLRRRLFRDKMVFYFQRYPRFTSLHLAFARRSSPSYINSMVVARFYC